ncbi:U4,U6 small nuclear ribonucleoprotein [Raphidocelis subcapitata]|uniref:U4,U6 small nuclear ribonucleoprotein n=1 Tax=Raphidocelis subcapitata TaxID=307507 RepID=A0A2V0NWC5_9CHLO|nr:U4,U6 small nuclear ribonucleoprotein [Raphidocelis subcapitata]|eukprot:GBF89870.1 U4,U6 small nuclear ribonucleoprotein [Raphidocelis subcapitata]
MASTFELTESARRDKEEQEKLLAEFELRRKIRATLVPTEDGKVREMLRQLGEPVTLFGEREMERHDRLKRIVAERDVGGLDGAPITGELVLEERVVVQKEVFYTEGAPALQQARLEIAGWSIPRAAARVRAAKQLQGDVEGLRAIKAARDASERAARQLAQQSSEIGDERPIGGCAFSPDGSLLAACGWGGAVNLWRATDSANVARVRGFRAHPERATGIAWHPQATVSQPEGAANILTGCADGSAALFALDGQQLQKLEGHTERLGRVAWHPMGQHVATSSFDMTWRLWDAETGACLLEQEGHSRGVYAVAFQGDGALAGSVGLDAIGRIWDCRTGRSVHVLEGHVKQILCIDFSPNGYMVATGSDDHSVRVWDLRKKACAYVVPAHRSLVSAVRWQPGDGHYLISSSYDATIKVWSTRDWTLLKVLAGHEGKVMAADVAPQPLDSATRRAALAAAARGGGCGGDDEEMRDADGDADGEGANGKADLGHLIGSAGYDRTVKLWAPQDMPDIFAGGDALPF